MSDDELDGVLFRFWIRAAETSPSKVARALASAHTEEDYRRALMKLAEDMRVNLPINERAKND